MNIKNKKVNKRNWSKLNYGKTKQIMVLINQDMFSLEKQRLISMNKKKQGRKYIYSNDIIELLIDFKNYFKMDYRKLQAFCLLFFTKIINIKVPDYTTVCRRMNKLELLLKNVKRKKRATFSAIDGSGMNTTDRGEWLRYIHKKGKIKTRNGFVKIVFAVDVSTAEITGVAVIDDSTHEGDTTQDLLEQTIKSQDQPIKGLLADGGYDRYNIFEMLNDANIEQIIKIRKNAITEEPEDINYRKRIRKKAIPDMRRTKVATQQLKDQEKWLKENNYNRRWVVEYTFSVFKRLFGQAIYTKRKKNVYNEIISKANLYNKLLNIN